VLKKQTHRPEEETFKELAQLCVKPGFIHIIAYFCVRDNIIKYSGKKGMNVKDTMALFSKERLVRTEISTLIGLMLKEKIIFDLPALGEFEIMVKDAERLLKEIHEAMMTLDDLMKAIEAKRDPFKSAKVLREPMFYGGEAAYIFQYRDLALKKYSRDDDWFVKNKEYSTVDAHKIISCIAAFQNEKVGLVLPDMVRKKPEERTMLPSFEFSAQDLAQRLDVDIKIIKNVLNSFSTPLDEYNKTFSTISDFNIINAYPLIKSEADKYILFHPYSLAEAFYETPFFWTFRDSEYKNKSVKNRGIFVEEFSKERLKLVFGAENVFSNVDIYKGKDVVGEIDVLVVFADRAIVLQAKSKKLTIESRKGNDQCLQEDFKKSIQESYEQGLTCSKLLENEAYELRDKNGNALNIVRKFKEIYIFCVVSEHYPALSFQARQFLQYEKNAKILPPFVIDVFMLDAITEMLQTPLYFLSYINRRTHYDDRVMAHHELTILSYHLQKNLWIDDKYNMLFLGDDIAADLDLAMGVRRGEMKGKGKVDGIITMMEGTFVGSVIAEIENKKNSDLIDFGFTLLSLNEEAINQINQHVKLISDRAQEDGKCHDFSIGGEEWGGLTIHCNNDSYEVAFNKLQGHCEKRKYAQKVTNWFGICIDPIEKGIKFAIRLNYEWKKSEEMERTIKLLSPILNASGKNKIGRNDICLCGSGKKYKKCCL
jgi:hypothetical protein